MKKIIGIVVLLLVVILGGYFGTGLVTEHTIQKNLAALNQANGMSAELVDYRRGLFTSDALLTWRMQVPEKVTKKSDGGTVVTPPKSYTFEMPLVMYHGPVMFQNGRFRFGLGSATGRLSLPDAYMEDFSSLFTEKSTKPKLTISFFITYLNKTHVEANIPEFQLFTKQHHTEIDWMGMDSDLRFSPESTRLQGNFLLEGLRILGKQFRIVLNKLSTSYDVHKTENGLFLGEARLALPSLQVTSGGKTELELKQLELNSKSDVDNDALFFSSFHGRYKSLVSREKTYGPAEVNVSLKNLDADILADLNQRFNQLQQMDTATAETPQLLFSLLPDVPKLLERGAVFEVSTLKAALPDGELDGSMKLAFPKVEPGEAPLQALPKVEGEGHLRMPAGFLKAVLARSIKDKLMRARAQALAGDSAASEPQADNKPDVQVAKSDEAKVQDEEDLPKVRALAPASLDEQGAMAKIDQQSSQEAEEKLAELVRIGALQEKGADYVLELKLSSGRLLVNGHPFHSGMLSF